MANTLRFKRGLVSTIPTAALGEPLFTTDTFDLYIGNGTGNTRFQKYIASGTTSQLLRGDGSLLTMPIVLTSPANGEVLKYNGTNWVNSSDAGVTGSGTNNYITKWTSASTIGNSLIQEGTNSIGIGVTPNAFGGTGLQIGVTAINNFGAISRFLNNASYDSGNNPLYIVSNFSTSYEQQSGYHRWLTAPSGTAAGAITFTERMRLHNTGNLHLGGTSDNGLRFQVTGDGYFSGSVGIGTSSLTAMSLRIAKQISGASLSYGVISDGQVQSSVTSVAYNFDSQANVASGFTLPNYVHFRAVQGTISGTLTNQYGYFVSSSLTSATNNYGFYGDIASGTGRWNLYMNGTADNYIAGQVVIGHNGLPSSAAWTRALVVGNSGTDKVILGYLASSTNGATIGANNSGFSAWATLNIAGSQLIFRNGETERMRLDASGRLGINTANPSNTLTVAGDIEIRNSGTFGSAQVNSLRIGTYVDSTLGSTISASTNYGATTNTDLRFSTSTGGAINERMRLFATGNLAVGTNTDAGFRLDVNGTMRVSGASTFSTSISSPLINLTATGSGVTNIGLPTGWIGTNNGGTIVTNISSTSLYIRSTSGNAIGFAAGGTTAQFILDSTGAATFSSSVTATIFANTSQTAFLLNNSAANNDFRMGSSSSQFRIVNAANTTALLTMSNTGESTFSSSVTCSSLVVDSTTLVVDATNNRVGVNTNVPTSSLHVVGSVTKSHTTKTANYTMTESDYTVLCDTTSGGFTISLPAASGCSGRIYVIKKITGNSGTNNITIDPNGSETIDGATTYALQCRSSVIIQSDGSNWWILAERVDNSCI